MTAPTTAPTTGAGQITLSREEATIVADLLGVVEDWLLGCSEFVLADLESFLPLDYGPSTRGPQRARRLIDDLGDAGVHLARLLRRTATTRRGAP